MEMRRYQWDQLAVMFGQLGVAAKLLCGVAPMEENIRAESDAAREEPVARPKKMTTLMLPEPV